MIERLLSTHLAESLQDFPAVALLGPRQVGKTTLAFTLVDEADAVYLDLEDPEDLLKLSDPLAFLSQYHDRLVIIDEIQRSPDLFMVLRGLIDKRRRAGDKTNHYLLLGSASMDLLRQSSESLAGRISYLEMSGLVVPELPDAKKTTINRLWLRGGFPESYLATSDAKAMTWLDNLARTYLERDLPQLGFRVSATRMRRLWTMLAHLQGEPVNFSKLAANLDVDSKTVASYIDILVDLLLVRRLEPWHSNVKKRLVKSPYFYIRDSGLLHALLGINSHEDLLGNPILGKSWEGFVIENILALLPNNVESYFYRTAAGAEIDLLLRFSATEIWAIEIKTGHAPKISKGFHIASEDVGAIRKFVVYGGEDEFPVSNDTTMISLEKLLNQIQEKVRLEKA